MRLLVTRPEPQASQWATALRDAGLDAQALPLIAISAPTDAAAVTALWHSLPTRRALMFVSPAAVDWFFRLRPPGATWPAQTLAAAPGPGTARALRAQGAGHGLHPELLVSPADDLGQFDSEALWPLLAGLDWSGQQVVIVSGGDNDGAKGRTWLTQQWRQQGAQVEVVQTYRRGPGHWQAPEAALARQALAEPASHLWLFSSSQAIDFLIAHHLPSLDAQAGDAARTLRALCTHPRIAERAQAAGMRDVHLCAPTLDAVVQARRSVA